MRRARGISIARLGETGPRPMGNLRQPDPLPGAHGALEYRSPSGGLSLPWRRCSWFCPRLRMNLHDLLKRRTSPPRV